MNITDGTQKMFNAPSREAIYKRIHKLALGKDWQYDYETFVEYDQKNIAVEKAEQAALTPSPMLSPQLNRQPFFKVEKIMTPEGEKIKVIMN